MHKLPLEIVRVVVEALRWLVFPLSGSKARHLFCIESCDFIKNVDPVKQLKDEVVGLKSDCSEVNVSSHTPQLQPAEIRVRVSHGCSCAAFCSALWELLMTVKHQFPHKGQFCTMFCSYFTSISQSITYDLPIFL